jgi:hypothetical protein
MKAMERTEMDLWWKTNPRGGMAKSWREIRTLGRIRDDRMEVGEGSGQSFPSVSVYDRAEGLAK